MKVQWMSERRELLTPIVTCTKKINLNSTTKSFNLKKVIILPLLELFRDVTSTFDCLKHRNLTERAKCFENCEQNQHYRLESYRWSKTITKLYVNIQINYLYKSFFIGFNITLVKYFWMKSLNNFLPFFFVSHISSHQVTARKTVFGMLHLAIKAGAENQELLEQ